MKDTENYVKIYKNCGRTLMFLKDEGSISFVKEDYCQGGSSYQEVIVPEEALVNAVNIPTSSEMTLTGKMELLFGCYDGMEHFVQFCDEAGIETMTLFWD